MIEYIAVNWIYQPDSDCIHKRTLIIHTTWRPFIILWRSLYRRTQLVGRLCASQTPGQASAKRGEAGGGHKPTDEWMRWGVSLSGVVTRSDQISRDRADVRSNELDTLHIMGQHTNHSHKIHRQLTLLGFKTLVRIHGPYLGKLWGARGGFVFPRPLETLGGSRRESVELFYRLSFSQISPPGSPNSLF